MDENGSGCIFKYCNLNLYNSSPSDIILIISMHWFSVKVLSTKSMCCPSIAWTVYFRAVLSNTLTENQCIEMIKKKSGALTALASMLGAVLATKRYQSQPNQCVVLP
jgi:geranylgeranyl pyrophosphate synthase